MPEETAIEARWRIALHEAGHLVALHERFRLCGFAVVTCSSGGQAEAPPPTGQFSTALVYAAGEEAERLASDFPPPDEAIPPAGPTGMSATASPAAVAWFRPAADVHNSDIDEEQVMQWTHRVPSKVGESVWTDRYHRTKRVARALILRRKGEVISLARTLYLTGEVDSRDLYEVGEGLAVSPPPSSL